jgi:hypothetical protein
MKRILLLLLNLFWMTNTYGSTLTPEEIKMYIDMNGTQATREKYFSCWEEKKAGGYARIETASEKWLKIAALLLQDSDACYTMKLQGSVSRALMNKPENVLPLVDSGANLEASYICAPFMADEKDPGILRGRLDSLNKLEIALKGVKNSKLQAQKNRCLARVKPLQSEIKEALTARPTRTAQQARRPSASR